MNQEKKLIRQLTPIGAIRDEGLIIPNHSGDHSAGIVNTTPTTNTDITNKKYVDDHDYWDKVGSSIRPKNLTSDTVLIQGSVVEGLLTVGESETTGIGASIHGGAEDSWDPAFRVIGWGGGRHFFVESAGNYGNVGIGSSQIAADDHPCANVLAFATAWEPDQLNHTGISVFSATSSDSAQTLGLFLEEQVEDRGATSDKRIKVKINGVEYYIALQLVT